MNQLHSTAVDRRIMIVHKHPKRETLPWVLVKTYLCFTKLLTIPFSLFLLSHSPVSNRFLQSHKCLKKNVYLFSRLKYLTRWKPHAFETKIPMPLISLNKLQIRWSLNLGRLQYKSFNRRLLIPTSKIRKCTARSEFHQRKVFSRFAYFESSKVWLLDLNWFKTYSLQTLLLAQSRNEKKEAGKKGSKRKAGSVLPTSGQIQVNWRYFSGPVWNAKVSAGAK